VSAFSISDKSPSGHGVAPSSSEVHVLAYTRVSCPHQAKDILPGLKTCATVAAGLVTGDLRGRIHYHSDVAAGDTKPWERQGWQVLLHQAAALRNAGATVHIVVPKPNRLARHYDPHWAKEIVALAYEAAGGNLHFADGCKLGDAIWAIHAAGVELETNRQNRKDDPRPLTGRIPMGFVRPPRGPVDVDAMGSREIWNLIIEVFRLHFVGKLGFAAISRALAAGGRSLPDGSFLSEHRIRYMIRNPVYCGVWQRLGVATGGPTRLPVQLQAAARAALGLPGLMRSWTPPAPPPAGFVPAPLPLPTLPPPAALPIHGRGPPWMTVN
jgi:hypothetical protein